MRRITFKGGKSAGQVLYGNVKGPWNNEPDKVEWISRSGLHAFVHRNHGGALCGYVAVPQPHPAYLAHYDDVDVESPHGGITYADYLKGHHDQNEPECGLFHSKIKDQAYWVLGFDCMHLHDLYPAEFKNGRRYYEYGDGDRKSTYKNLSYVMRETELFADRLAKMK